VVNTWKRETEKFTPDLSAMIHHGPDRKQKKAFIDQASAHALVVTSYALLHRDIAFMEGVDWAGVILDEAQNIKNPGTKQTRAAKQLKAGYRIALTGTPVENNVGDLWSIMDFLNPGLLGSQSVFHQSFFRPIQLWRNEEAAQKLKKLTGPFILRRLKTDRSIIRDLPDKIEQKEYCRLTREQASLYQAVLDDMQEGLEKSEGIQRKGLVLATLSKLKQVCNHPAQFIGDGSSIRGRSGKLLRLEEILQVIRDQNERTLVFTQFAQMGELLRNHLQEQFGREVLFLHGGVAKKKRDEMIERFQTEPEGPRIFILSLKAGGTGLTLTRANHVVHFDRWWNPAVENQATDRVFRIGQQKNVLVHKFVVAGTLEERIDEMIESKTELAEQIVGAGENWITELSNDDLRALTRLGQEAVGD
jgi:SNF2 family DNA or RNA helicase